MEKKLKNAVIILLIILISLISFAGIYSKRTGKYVNILPEYTMGSNLTGKRILEIKLSDATEKIIKDSDGNVVDEIPEGANEEDYTTTEEPINKEEKLTKQNYNKVKDIISKRLDYLKISDYNIRVNNQNGDMVIKLSENNETDKIASYIETTGEFKIIDTDTKEELMNNSDVNNARVVYGSTDSGEIQVYFEIEFTKVGKEKFKEITNNYKKIENENSDKNTDENQNEETKQKTITIMLSGNTLLSTYFNEEIISGKLQLSIGDPSKDQNEIYKIADEAKIYLMMINCGVMPLSYEQASNEYVEEEISNNTIQYIIYGLITIIAINIIYLVIKYKDKGLLTGISYIGGIALFLIILRYTSAVITINTIASAIILIILNWYINIYVLNNIKDSSTKDEYIKNIKKTMPKISDIIIVSLIISVVFIFASSQAISSVGVMLFYGMISTIIEEGLLLLMCSPEK